MSRPCPPLALTLLALACQSSSVAPRDGGPPGPAPGREPPGGFGLPDAGADAPAAADACTKVSCTPPGGRYCGKIGDGCGGQVVCGDCPAGSGEVCGAAGNAGVCGRPPAPGCAPIACAQPGGKLCGRVGDGCGKALECGGCPPEESCGPSRVCIRGRCDNLCALQVSCPGGAETTLTGVVLAPTPPRFGAPDPVYNARVYVPNQPLAPFAPGVACESCEAQISGAPLVSAVSGADGKFVLRNVPAGTDIPLVVQIGRWRRLVKIPRVEACTTTALPAELTRLPRTRAEGDIPQLAIATGAYDPVECLLRKIGIDDGEFTLPSGPGRVHMYRHFGSELAGGWVPGDMLTGSREALSRYDIVLLPCDSHTAKPPAAVANLVDYAARGGRLFLTDWSDMWLRDAPGFQALAGWRPAADHLGNAYQSVVDQSFPKGQAFATWLSVAGAAPTPGRIPIHDIYMGGSLLEAVRPPAQRWLYTEQPRPSVQHFTFNTPVGTPPERQCGRVIYSNFHVVPDPAAASPVFPAFCADTPMTPQEKALEFMLFDAAACVQPDADKPRVFEPPPPAPPVPPPSVE